MIATFFIVLIAIAAAAVAVYGIRSWHRTEYADHRRILAAGGATSGTVVALGPPDVQGWRVVTIEYAVAGRTRRAPQSALAAACDALGLAPGMPIGVRYRPDRPAIAFAPALLLAAYSPLPVLAPGNASGATLYAVAFEDPDRPSTLRPQNAFGWTGGELLVDDTMLTVRAVRARPFRKSAAAARAFPLGWVRNVEVLGRLVALEIAVDGVANPVRLWTVDAAAAADLARRLPTNRTESFVPVLAETLDFHRQLIVAMPATPVTTGLVAINLLAFVLAGVLGAGWFAPDSTRLVGLGSNYTTLTMGGQWWRLLSNTFLHFGALHVGFNMWALYVNGPFAERLYGSTRYLLIYLIAGVGASLASLWWHPLVNSAGASGAIFGVFGATLAFFVRAPAGVPDSVATSHRNSILRFIALTLVLGLQAKFIDHAAHLGGLIVGFVLGYLLARPVGSRSADPARERQHALGLAVAAAAVLAVLVLGGPTSEAISATVPGGVPGVVPHPTLTMLAGVRLGETRAELEAGRGKPVRDQRDTWLYDLGTLGHPALLDVTFHLAGRNASADDRVGAIFYRGGKEHAPPELLYVAGQPRAQLVADFGQPAWLLHAKDGIEYQMYADGLTVEFEHDRARAYGVQDYYLTLHD